MCSKPKRIHYSKEEKNTLITLVENYKSIIENKKTNAIHNKQKDEAWDAITKQFNTRGTVMRDIDSLRKQWSNIKQEMKKKALKHQAETYTANFDSDIKIEVDDDYLIPWEEEDATKDSAENSPPCHEIAEPNINENHYKLDEAKFNLVFEQKLTEMKRREHEEKLFEIELEHRRMDIEKKKKLDDLEIKHKEKMYKLEEAIKEAELKNILNS